MPADDRHVSDFREPDDEGARLKDSGARQSNENDLPGNAVTAATASESSEQRSLGEIARRTHRKEIKSYSLMGRRSSDSQPVAETNRIIAESVSESLKETSAWILETVVVVGVHCINPVLGHVVTIAFKIKEMVGDIEGLTSQDSELHLPILPLGPGIDLELAVHLGSKDGPLVTVFAAPVAGDLCGAFAVEKDEEDDQEGANRKAEPSAKDAARRAADVAGAPSDDSVLYALIACDLSDAVEATADSRRRAAALRNAASLLQRRLRVRSELADRPLIVVYDERASLGMWMILESRLSEVAERHIELRPDTETGLITIRIV